MVNWEEKLKDKNIKVIGYATEGLDWIYEPEYMNWFNCIDEMEDWFESRDLDLPKYAYGTYFEPVALDLDHILEDVCEEHAEDTRYMLEGVSELKEAIEEFNKANSSISNDFYIFIF